MNKRVLLGIGIIFVVVLFAIIKIVTKSNEFELTYKTNGGVPYEWKYEIEDESIVQFVRTKDITSKENEKLVGGPVYINYVFKGIKEGETTITFKYVSVVDGTIEKEDKVTVKVDSHKKISLVSSS